MITDEISGRNPLSITDIQELEYSLGIDYAQIWVDKLLRKASKLKGSQSKTELIAVVSTGQHAKIGWADSESILEKNPNLDEEQVDAVVKATNKQCAMELIHEKDCQVAVNAFLQSMMGKTSLEVLKADPVYDENDKTRMDPTVTWERIMATHILERDGPGLQKQIISVNKLLYQFTAMKHNASTESITEYAQKIDRAKKALSTSGFDVDKMWLDSDEKRVIHFLHSLDPTKYGGLIRDVANGVVAVPSTITDLLTIARDRKEIAYGGAKRDRTLLSNDNKSQDPLQPYEWLSYDEWAALSAERREKMSEHNTRIQKAGDELAKMGWAEGRWKKRNKPSDNPAQRYLTAVKERKKKWEPKRKHDRTMVTRSQEDAESDDFDDEVILLTKSYRDAVCLMTTCTPIVELDDITSEQMLKGGEPLLPLSGDTISSETSIPLVGG